mgnify:CR=1 FL=1
MDFNSHLTMLINRFKPYVHFDIKPLLDLCLKDEKLIKMSMNERDAVIMYSWRMASTLVEEFCMALQVEIMKLKSKKEKE